MNWFETLPSECPPKEAVDTNGYTVYRIALSDPPTEYDFQSHKMRFPTKSFHVDDCQARSLSVYDDLEIAQKVTKLPSFNRKTTYIVELNLESEDGLILKTSGDNHYSFWRSQSFIIPIP